MKLMKKLLPLATAASVAAIVTPIATSCGGNSSGWLKADYELDPVVEGFKLCPDEELPTEYNVAVARYAEIINSDKQIVYDDYTYWLSRLDNILYNLPLIWFMFSGGDSDVALVYVDVNTFEAKISDLTIDTNRYTLTHDLQLNLDVDAAIEIPKLSRYSIDPQISFNLNMSLDVHYENCPFYIGPDYINAIIAQMLPTPPEKIYGAACLMNIDRMLADSSWYQDINVDLTFKAFNDDVELGLDFDTDKELHITSDLISILELIPQVDKALVYISQIIGGWSSYYYSKMEWYIPQPRP